MSLDAPIACIRRLYPWAVNEPAVSSYFLTSALSLFPDCLWRLTEGLSLVSSGQGHQDRNQRLARVAALCGEVRLWLAEKEMEQTRTCSAFVQMPVSSFAITVSKPGSVLPTGACL